MTGAGEVVSESAWSMIGEPAKIDGEPGYIIDVEASGSTITTAKGDTYPGVRFLVRYLDGSEQWTVTFADKGDWNG